MAGCFCWILLTAAAGQVRLEAADLNDNFAGKEVVVEGVVKSRSGRGEQSKLRLERCKAVFLASEIQLQEVRARENVEITGVARVRNDAADSEDRLYVQVRSLKRLPTDIQRFEIKASGLTEGDSEGWNKLAVWAKRRYELFQDPDIGARARIAGQNAITAERKSAAGNPRLLSALRDRLKSEKLIENFDFDGLEHEILHAELNFLGSQTSENLRAIAANVHDRLLQPAGDSLAPLEVSQQKSYLTNPVAWYLLAGKPVRRQLARFWKISLLDRANRMDAERLGQTASAKLTLAESASNELPDYPTVLNPFVRSTVDGLLQKMDRLNDRELARAATLIETVLGDRRQADRVRQNWLRGQYEQLKTTEQLAAEQAKRLNAASPPLDAHERLRLGNLWLAWFPGVATAKSQAGQLLVEASLIDSKLVGPELKLRELGYRPKSGGGWVSPELPGKNGTGREAEAMSSIKIGDKADKVRDLLGVPTTQTRVLGKEWISHVWEYEGVTYILREDMRSGYSQVTAIHSTSNRGAAR